MYLEYQDQEAKNLKLTLVEGVLKEDISSFCSQTLQNKQLKVDVNIIGASHYVTLCYKGKFWTELFACIALKNSKPFKSIKEAANLEDGYRCITPLGTYSFHSKILPWGKAAEKVYKEFERFESSSEAITCSFDFPSKSKKSFEARTALYVVITTNMVAIKSLHAYPNEEQIVVSNSNIKLTQKKR